ncbi:hypothetical protein ACA910_011010 [Epithemia clementina (nom. ined.)]
MNTAIEEALRQGRWGEIVTIEAIQDGETAAATTSTANPSAKDETRPCAPLDENGDDDNCVNNLTRTTTTTNTTKPSSISLTPCLDSNHGGFMWNPIYPPNYGLSYFLRTKQWLFPMLNDHRRNNSYHDAIEKALHFIIRNQQKINAEERCRDKRITILDIGCGTGLWGMVAARYMRLKAHCDDGDDDNSTCKKNLCRVLSIDMSRFMVRMAEQIVKDNHLDHLVSVQEMHSMQLRNADDNDDDSNTVVLCISELLEHGLLGEGWLPTIRNLLERQIVPENAIVIPSSATVYAQAVQTVSGKDGIVDRTSLGYCDGGDVVQVERMEAWSQEYLGPRNFKSKFGITLKWPQLLVPATSVVLPVHAHALAEKGRLSFLSNFLPILNISAKQQQLSTSQARNTSFGRHVQNLTITKSGWLDAILVWWDLHLIEDDDFHNEKGICYSSIDPNNQNATAVWQDHWQPCLHILEQPLPVSRGDTCILEAWHTDNRIHVDVVSISCNTSLKTKNKENAPSSIELSADNNPPTAKRLCRRSHGASSKNGLDIDDAVHTPVSTLISPLRARQLNNVERLETLCDGLDHLLQSTVHPSLENTTPTTQEEGLVILDVADFCLCGLLAAQLASRKQHGRGCRVFSIESCTSSGGDQGASNVASHIASLPFLSAQMTQLNIAPPADEKNIEFQVVQCHPEAMSCNVLFGDNYDKNKNSNTTQSGQYVDLLVGEPYYEMTETWPLISAMNFFNIVRHLRAQEVLTPNTHIFPASARVCACAISSPQLAGAYEPCGRHGNHEMVLGLNHSYLNHERRNLGKGTIVLSLPMWQYRYDRIGPTVCMTTLQYNKSSCSSSILHDSVVLPLHHASSGDGGCVCNGILVWVEYDLLSGGGTDRCILSTNAEYEHQLVIFLEEPYEFIERSQDDALICTFRLQGCAVSDESTHPFEFELSRKPVRTT